VHFFCQPSFLGDADPASSKMARPGETLDMTEPPSEAFDRREAVGADW
jgi:hypothetical protein